MKSKKPFFSRELIYNNMKRFWWITALYTLALFLVSPLVALNRGSYINPEIRYNISFSDIFDGTILFLFVIPVFIGVMIFRYMQNSKSMVTMHSMPYTRLRLYVNNVISGLILLLTPILLNTAFLFIIQAGNVGGAVFKEGIVLKYLGVSVMTSVTLYIWTIFIGMFTGSSIAQIIFTYISNFLLAGIVAAGQMLLNGVLYGFVGNESICEKFLQISPIAQAVYMTNYIQNPGILYFLIVDIVICMVGLVVGYYIYKYRDLETAGDVISGKYVKPIFKYGVTVCTMLVGAIYVKELCNVDSVSILIYLIFALIGYVVAEMLLRKSFKVWNSYKGFLFFSIVFIIVAFGLKADMFGYEKYVPNIDGIKCASLSNDVDFLNSSAENPSYGVLYEKSNIEKIIALHQSIVDDEKYNLANDMISKESISISYKLLDGRIVKRVYSFEEGRYDTLLNAIYDDKEYIKAINSIFDYTADDIYTMRISNALIQDNFEYVTIDNKEEIKELLEAMQTDLLNTPTAEKDKYLDIYGVEVVVKEDKKASKAVKEKARTYLYYDDMAIADFDMLYFDMNSENVVNFINEKGYREVLQNNDNIVDMKLYYNNDSNEIKTIFSKEKISQVMEALYNKSPEKNYGMYYDGVSIEIDTVHGNTNRVQISKNGSESVIKLFE